MGILRPQWRNFLLGLFFVSGVAAAEPHHFQGTLSMAYCGPSQKTQLITETLDACRKIHRAYYAVANFIPEIKNYFRTGVNIETLMRNRPFYLKALGNRFRACDGGHIKMRCEGACRTENERIAYVPRPFGFISDTIHLCQEYFETQSHSVQEIAHEMGRLEDIGDSTEWDTDNIFVWDRIVELLGDEHAFSDLESLSKAR